MGKRKYLPMSPSDVIEIVVALGFVKKRKSGSHWQYERVADKDHSRAVVTIDESPDQFDDFLMKSMISQSGFSVEQFYGATKRSARKAGVKLYVVGGLQEPTA